MKSLLQILRYINAHPLSGRHKIKAFLLFLRWQLSQTLMPYPVEYPFVGNTKLLIKKGMTGATGNIYTGLHEFSDMGFLLHFLRKDDLFMDVGANIGSYSVLAAGYAEARAISIEPVPQTFESLRKNIAINNLGSKVKIMNCGLGADERTVSFTSDHDTVNHVEVDIANSNEKLIQVRIHSLDSVLPAGDIPVLIKIDVEGYEQEVINGATATLGNKYLKALIIELNGSGGRYGFDEKRIHKQLMEFGFEPFAYDPLKRELTAIKTFGNVNTLYIRDTDYVRERIKTAPVIKLFSESF